MQKIDSKSDFSSDSDYDEFANEMSFVDDILQPFQFEPVLTIAEIQVKRDLTGTCAIFFKSLLHHRTCAASSLSERLAVSIK